MPRIAHVISTPHGLGGAERVLAALVEEGSKRGWSQLVLNPFGEQPSELSRLCEGRASFEPRTGGLPRVLALRTWIARRLSGFAPNVVHVHLFHAAALVASLPKERRVRLLTHHHGDLFAIRHRPVLRAIDKWAGRRFDQIVAVSESVKRFLVDEYRYAHEKVVCIPNGWSGTPIEEPRDGLDPTVVCVSNLRPEKSHVTLLDAFRRVRREIPSCRLVLVGDGPLRSDLEARAGALGISEAVSFTGFVPNIWPYLQAADLFALPSSYETLGIAAIEAMAAGLPIVASRTGAIPEFVHEDTGVLVPPGDPGALAAAIVGLLSSPESRRRMSVAARERAQGLRMESTVQRYFELYERVLARR